MIKELREKTGLSIAQCKEALAYCQNDINKALDYLKDKSAQISEKKSARETGVAIVASYVHMNKIGALIKVACETDFVAKNIEFIDMAKHLAVQVVMNDVGTIEELFKQEYMGDFKNHGITVKQYIDEHIFKFGENIKIDSFVRYSV